MIFKIARVYDLFVRCFAKGPMSQIRVGFKAISSDKNKWTWALIPKVFWGA
jgi:hypothetical protein